MSTKEQSKEPRIGRHRIVVEVFAKDYREALHELVRFTASAVEDSKRGALERRTCRRVHNGTGCSFKSDVVSESERAIIEEREFRFVQAGEKAAMDLYS